MCTNLSSIVPFTFVSFPMSFCLVLVSLLRYEAAFLFNSKVHCLVNPSLSLSCHVQCYYLDPISYSRMPWRLWCST